MNTNDFCSDIIKRYGFDKLNINCDYNEIKNTLSKFEDFFDKFAYSKKIDEIFDRILSFIFSYLDSHPPSNNTNQREDDIRRKLLELLSSLPTCNITDSHIDKILNSMHKIIQQNDNEDNTIIAFKVIVDYIRSFRPAFNERISIFLKTIPAYYSNLNSIGDNFELIELNEQGLLPEDSSSHIANFFPIESIEYDLSSLSVQENTYITGNKSLKVLHDIHVFIILSYQLYRPNISNEIEFLVPYMVKVLNLQPSLSSRKLPSFNKELHVDFLNVQMKIISLIIFLRRLTKNEVPERDVIGEHGDKLVRGVLGILRYFPKEIPHLYKELILYARHIIAADKKEKIVNYCDSIIQSFTLRDIDVPTTEPLNLQITQFLYDIAALSKNIIPLHSHHLCLNFLLSLLIDSSITITTLKQCVKISTNYIELSKTSVNRRFIGVSLVRGFAQRIYDFSKLHETIYQGYLRKLEESNNNDTAPSVVKYKKRIEISLNEGREVIRLLVYASRVMVQSMSSLQVPLAAGFPSMSTNMYLNSDEVEVFRHLYRYGIHAFSCFRSEFTNDTRTSTPTKTKDEKDVTEIFCHIFCLLNTANQIEIFSPYLDLLFQRIGESLALQNIPNTFLYQQSTTSLCAELYLTYFMEHFKEFGGQGERPIVLFRVLKMILASTAINRDNEAVIKSHVCFILESSLRLMLDAGQTLNYLLLLRALFRSIGSSNNDTLYHVFLPQLRNILTAFNRYRTPLQQSIILDVLIELSLSIPVRLSNLVPHMSLLMEPLVTSLKTSSATNNQGHRTLELCLDTLHILFIDNVMDEVRNDILVELCRRTSQSPEHGLYAARLIGKMGGAAVRPSHIFSKLEAVDVEFPCCINLNHFKSSIPLKIPMFEVLKSATNLLSQTAAILSKSSLSCDDAADEILIFYAKEAYSIVKNYFLALIPSESLERYTPFLVKKLPHNYKFEKDHQLLINYKNSKNCFKISLTGLFHSLRIEEFREESLTILIYSIRVLVLMSMFPPISYTIPIILGSSSSEDKAYYLSPSTFVSSLFIFSSETDVLSLQIVKFFITLIFDTAKIYLSNTTIRLTDTKIYQKFHTWITKYSCNLSWESKYSCMQILRQISTLLPLQELRYLEIEYLTLLYETISSLFSEISCGTVDYASDTILYLLKLCHENDQSLALINDQFTNSQKKLINLIVKQIHANSNICREVSQKALKYLSEVWETTICNIVSLETKFINDKFFKSNSGFQALPLTAQLAEMDALVFYATIKPPFFIWNLANEAHEKLANLIITYCESDIQYYNHMSATKNLQDIDIVRYPALLVLETLKDNPVLYIKIISALCKAMISSDGNVLYTAKNMVMTMNRVNSDDSIRETISMVIRPLLLKLAETHQFNILAARQMRCLVETFPNMFNEKLCDQFIIMLRESLSEYISTISKTDNVERLLPHQVCEQLNIWSTIIDMFHLLEHAKDKFIHQLLMAICDIQQNIGIRKYPPLLINFLRFLNKFPEESIEMFMHNIQNNLYFHIFIMLLKIKRINNNLRTGLLRNPNIFCSTTLPKIDENDFDISDLNIELTFIGCKIIWVIQKRHKEFLSLYPYILSNITKLYHKMKLIHFKSQDYERIYHLITKSIFYHLSYKINDFNLLIEIIPSVNMSNISTLITINIIPKIFEKYSVENTASFFATTVEYYHGKITNAHRCSILIHLLIPLFTQQFKSQKSKELMSPCLNILKNYDKLMSFNQPYKYGITVRSHLAHLTCIFIENVSQEYNNFLIKDKSDRLKMLMEFLKPSIMHKYFSDPNSKHYSYLLIAHLIDKYYIDGEIVIKIYHELLKAHTTDSKTVVKKALDLIIKSISIKNKEGLNMLAYWTKKLLIEDNNVILASLHILSIIHDHRDVFYHVRETLLVPMINCLIRLNNNISNITDEKPFIFDVTFTILKWQVKSPMESDFSQLSILFSYLIKTYCILSNDTSSIVVSEVIMSKALDILRFAITHNLFTNFSFEFRSFDSQVIYANLPIDVTQPSYIQSVHSCILLSISFLNKLITECKENTVVYNVIAFFTDKIVHILRHLITHEISIQNIHLIGLVFQRYSDNTDVSFKLVEPLFQSCLSYITETFEYLQLNLSEKSNHKFGILLLTKMINGPCTFIWNKYSRNVYNLMLKYESASKTDQLSPHNDDRLDIVSNLATIFSCGLHLCSQEFQTEITIVLSNISRHIRSYSISVALCKYFKFILEKFLLEHENYNDLFLESFSQFVFNLAYVINLDQPFDHQLNFDLYYGFKKLYELDKIWPPSCCLNLESVYHSGILNFSPKIRQLYINDRLKSFNINLFEKMNYFFHHKKYSHMFCFHSWIKLWIRILIHTNNNSQKIVTSNMWSTFPPLALLLGSRSDEAYLSQPAVKKASSVLFSKFNVKKFFATLIESKSNEDFISLLDYLKMDSSLNNTENCFTSFSLGREAIDHSSINQQNIFLSISNLLFYDGNLTDIVFKSLFNSIWSTFNHEQHKNLMDGIENFLKSTTDICFNDSAFFNTIMSSSKTPAIFSQNQNSNTPTLVNAFTGSTLVQIKQSPILKYQVFLKIGCLPKSSINTFITTMLSFDPKPPVIFPSILSYISKKHYCPGECALYLEKFTNVCVREQPTHSDFNYETPAFDLERYRDRSSSLHNVEVIVELESIYEQLTEEDYKLGLWTMNSIFGSTVTGLGLASHGFFEKAADSFEYALANYEYGSVNLFHKKHPLYQYESRLWYDSWMSCMKELGNWGRLLESTKRKIFVDSNCRSVVVRNALDSSWKMNDFASMKQLLNYVQTDSEIFKESYMINYYKIILALFAKEPCPGNQNITEFVNENISIIYKDLAHRISVLPTIITPKHLFYFRNIHIISEIQEMFKLCTYGDGLTSGGNNQESVITALVNDFKNIQKSWRIRYPDKLDNLSHWAEVFSLRMFTIATAIGYMDQNVSKTPQTVECALPYSVIANFPANLFDSPQYALMFQAFFSNFSMSCIKFATISRQQDQFSISLDVIEHIKSLFSLSQNASCYCLAIVQEVKNYLGIYANYGDSGYLEKALNIVNFNMNKRQNSKDVHLFLQCLRSRIQYKLMQVNEAHAGFSESLDKNDHYSGWAGWGNLLCDLFMAKNDYSLGVNAIIAYLNATRSSSSPYRGHKYIAQCMWLLENDSPLGILSSAFNKYSNIINFVYFLRYVTHLYRNLLKPYGDHFVPILSGLGMSFPQVVFSYARIFNSVNNNLPLTQEPPIQIKNNTESVTSKSVGDAQSTNSAAKRIKQIVHTLQLHDSCVIYYLENFIESIYGMGETPLERLYRLSKFSLNMACSESCNSKSKAQKISETLKSNIITLYEEANKLISLPRSVEMIDLNNTTLKQLVNYLADIWKIVQIAGYKLPKRMILSRASCFFNSLLYNDVMLELPGEFRNTKWDTIGFSCTRIIKFSHFSEFTMKPGHLSRRISFLCNNGKHVSYLIIFGKSYQENFQEECVFQLLDAANAVFLSKRDSFRRNLHFSIPFHFTYGLNLKLIQDDLSNISLFEIMKNRLKGMMLDEFSVLELLINIYNASNSNETSMNSSELDEQANKLLPNNVLENWAKKTYPNAMHYFYFRKHFTIRLSLISLFEYALNTLPLYPEMAIITKSTGSLFFTDLKFDIFLTDPLACLNSDVDRKFCMRLTPNIQQFITDIGINGPFAHAMFSASFSIIRGTCYWVIMLKLILTSASFSWSSTISSQIKDSLTQFITDVTSHYMNNFAKCGNPEEGLVHLTNLIEKSCDPNNILSQDPLWYPLL